MDVAALRESLVDCAIVNGIDFVDEVDSTNSELLRRVDAHGMKAVAGTLLIAAHQTGGRGRRERAWHSAPGENLLCSLAIEPPLARESWGWLAQIAGLALADALNEAADCEALVKWPNDVCIDEKKIAGILVESRVGSEGGLAIIGVGVNAGSHPDLDDMEGMMATSLKALGKTASVTAVCESFARSMDHWMDVAGADLEEIRKAVVGKSMILGREVIAKVNGDEIRGFVQSIAEDGSLILDSMDGPRSLTAVDQLRLA